MKQKKILVFDFETTGLDPKNDQIIEIGAILLQKNDKNEYKKSDEFSALVLTEGPLPPIITQITGITDEVILRNGIHEKDAFNMLSKMIDDETLLIAYNIQFDLGFLDQLYRKHQPGYTGISNDILDVMAVYKDRHPYPHRLTSALEKYMISLPNSHRALDDALATYVLLFDDLKKEKDNIHKYVNVIGFNQKYGVSGPRLAHVVYIPQMGGREEIAKMMEKEQ